MSTLLFITCSNGLGHFKRVVKMVDFILEMSEGLAIKVSCTVSQYEILKDWDLVKRILRNKHFSFVFCPPNIQWDAGGQLDGSIMEWVNELDEKMINDADAIVCDNMAGILAVREDALLCGSFLWSEVLLNKFPENEMAQAYHDMELNLLARYNPKMLCLQDMEMPYVSQYTQPVHFSWMAESTNPIPVRNSIKNILVVSGETGAADVQLSSLIGELLAAGNFNVFTTNRLLKNMAGESSNLHEFSFEDLAFSQTDLIVGRPGIGLLTDAVTFGIPILMEAEHDNLEMMHNMHCVQSIGFGKALASNDNLPAWVSEIQSNGSYGQMVAKLGGMKKDGIAEAGNFILTHFNLN
jgi:hypothetical protein